MNHTHKDLVEIAHKWVLKNTSCGVAFKELSANGVSEVPDVIGFGAWNHSVLVEVKVSKNDFLSDRKKLFRIDPEEGMGFQRFYFCPTGLIKINDLPFGWGLVYIDSKGKAKIEYLPYKGNIGERHDGFATRNHFGERAIMYSALRRLQLMGRIEEVYESLKR